jgi:hypothetical protein
MNELHCLCGGFLPREPDRHEPAQYMKTCDGQWGESPEGDPLPEGTPCGKFTEHEPHDYPASECVILHRKCTRCSRNNQEVSLYLGLG